jgi:formylglycine-generating enzyme required for sulfatase activity
MLDLRLVEGQPVPRVISPVVWRESLPQDQTLELVEIPAGEFMMGSPEEEEGRDWYQNSSYVDTKGLNLEQQHRVSLPGFALGQHPVTQAQWRAVASLPAINYELNPDPAQFKGDHRPVEMVSWYEAVEFCDRLSQHTGKPYRLPSEAEWEYACRAGTPTPFYFGDTITTDLANYDGNYTYAGGPKGKYREQTTPVGQFGVNPWGLADMHGNVLEWCEDHWHPSYEGAPSDGSAWITDDANQLRLVRGGSWYSTPVNCRSAVRSRSDPRHRFNFIGFRVVCAPPGLL